MDTTILGIKIKMMNKTKITEKIIWIAYIPLLIAACETAFIMDNWLGYIYCALLYIAILIDDFKIIKGYWVQFIPIPLTIAYLLYEHKPVMYMLKKIFNWE